MLNICSMHADNKQMFYVMGDGAILSLSSLLL